jgi:hypothetical protein
MPQPTTYESEINTPSHKPGMESVVNRGSQHAVPSEGDTRDQSGNRTGARRQVSPPTESAFGPASHSDPPPPTSSANKQAPPSTPSADMTPGSGGKVREQKITDYVDKAAGTGTDSE